MIERDLRCPQGDSFHFSFIVREAVNGEPGDPRDLTGFTAHSEVRDSLKNGNLVASMDFNSTDEDLENGVVSLYIPAETMADIEVGTYYYDIVLADNVDVKTYFAGKFLVLNKMTQNV